MADTSTLAGSVRKEACILVTGASGFVGSHAVEAIRRAMPEANVVRVDSYRHAGDNDGDSLVLDVARRAEVDTVVADIRPTAVLHLAALAAPVEAEADPIRAWEVNVFGTMHLAAAVLQHAPEARFLYVGSSELYGESFNLIEGPLSEEAPLRPLSHYATSKAAADIVVGQFAYHGLRAIRFRPFNHTGAGQAADYVVAAFARQIARIEKGLQEPVIEVGALDGERDFVDVRDIVRAYVTAITMPTDPEPGIILNLASGRPQRIRSILDRLIAIAGVSVDVRVDPSRYRQSRVARTWGSSELAGAVLGWSPTIPFEQTLADVVDDWRERTAT